MRALLLFLSISAAAASDSILVLDPIPRADWTRGEPAHFVFYGRVSGKIKKAVKQSLAQKYIWRGPCAALTVQCTGNTLGAGFLISFFERSREVQPYIVFGILIINPKIVTADYQARLSPVLKILLKER